MSPSADEIRAFVMPIVASLLGGFPAADREDIGQDVWIACWQKLSCQEVDDWKAYCSQIARHKVADLIRRRDRLRRMLEHIKMEYPEFDRGDWDLPTELQIQRAVYLILRFFLEHRAKCADTAMLRFFQSLPWDQVGRRLSLTTDAIRQRWHRCVEFLLEAIGPEVSNVLDGRIDDSEVLR
jgi:RNA polymerase sigma factor (sigma-70 family)